MMTANGVTTTAALGQEQHETFTRKSGKKTKRYTQYDYRHTDGELFSTAKPTLEQCRAARDEWLERKELAAADPRMSPQERTRAAVYASGNKWAIENFNATH